MDLNFYKHKKVFITGHTGFKGSWLCRILMRTGAVITGYSLSPCEKHSLYSLSELDGNIRSIIGDIRDLESLKAAFNEAKPEIVIHLAAQPIVREGYRDPAYTYETNVMGTVNILECIRHSSTVESFLNVTTDKVYHNNEWIWGYRENEELNGFDPYSNSKSCSELVTQCYKNCFFTDGPAISTTRAGNVIGGGDFSCDRIIPDCIRAVMNEKDILVRNPYSIRPYQHVLEPLFAYLLIAAKQAENNRLSGCYNVGPDECDCLTTGELVALFCRHWGDNIRWRNNFDDGPHEANFLKLDCSKIKKAFDWKPTWHIDEAVKRIVDWTKVYLSHGNISLEMDKEINDFMEACT